MEPSTPTVQPSSDVSVPIRRVREVEVYRNRFVTLFDDEVEFPGGKPGRYVRLAAASGHPGVVLLVVSGDRLALVSTYRYPVRMWQWSLPRGFGHTADPLESAAIELTEVTGIVTAHELTLLGHVTPDSGTQDSRVAVVLATVDRADSVVADIDPEVSGLQWPTVEQVRGLIGSGSIEDGFTLSALTLAFCRDLL